MFDGICFYESGGRSLVAGLLEIYDYCSMFVSGLPVFS